MEEIKWKTTRSHLGPGLCYLLCSGESLILIYQEFSLLLSSWIEKVVISSLHANSARPLYGFMVFRICSMELPLWYSYWQCFLTLWSTYSSRFCSTWPPDSWFHCEWHTSSDDYSNNHPIYQTFDLFVSRLSSSITRNLVETQLDDVHGSCAILSSTLWPAGYTDSGWKSMLLSTILIVLMTCPLWWIWKAEFIHKWSSLLKCSTFLRQTQKVFLLERWRAYFNILLDLGTSISWFHKYHRRPPESTRTSRMTLSMSIGLITILFCFASVLNSK